MLQRAIALTAALLAAATMRVALGQSARETSPQLADVPAGEFSMGSDIGGSWEKPVHKVRTPAFEIGERPVSNGEFRRFRSDHSSPGDNADSAPVTGVSWEDAHAYCEWLSQASGATYSIPSEARWERAVRGGLEQKKYPWGDEPEPDGSERRNAYGVYAVGHGLWEWTADWYSADYYAHSPANDPTGPADGVYRVLRGGGYRNDPASATVYTRGSARPETKSERITFRVMRASGGAAAPTTVTRAAPPPTPRQTQPVQTAAAAQPKQSPPPTPAAQPKPATKPAPAPNPTPAAGARPGGPVAVTGVSFAEEGGEGVVKIATDGVARFKAFALKAPDRLVVDILDGTGSLRPVTGTVQVGRVGIKTVRHSQFQATPPIFRIVIDLQSAKDYRVEAWPNELRIKLKP
ncbi:MAG: SUMF1/EgtB/PvdO family nonheme iron enzyme [Bryobacterales bacterium]